MGTVKVTNLNSSHCNIRMTMENFSVLNKKLDPTSSLWKKKYTLLLKRAENVEKQNLRLINRLYQIKKITKRLVKEKKFLVKRLDGYNDDFRNTKFYLDTELLPEGTSDAKKKKKGNNSNDTNHIEAESTSPKPLGLPPRKPMSAFFRYCQAQHLKILQEKSHLSHDEIKKNLSEKWNGMSDAEKEIYLDSFEEDRDSYEKEMSQFLSNFKESAEVSGISHNMTDEEPPQEEESGEIEGDGENDEMNIDEKFPKEANEQLIKMEEEEQFNSSLSDEQASASSDDENEENG